MGQYEWLKHGQGTANNRAIALAYDASQGQVWLGGMFQQSLSLAESNWQAEAGPLHQQDLYWIGLDTKGKLRAGAQYGGPGNDQLTALLMAPGPVLYLIGRQVRADGTANGFILNGQLAPEARPEAQKP
ncbi:MAG: hypothetical protein HC913_02010 [Microscillaceae bacterium]|nr:hypothetical protein [Microscillaceae bacterium]